MKIQDLHLDQEPLDVKTHTPEEIAKKHNVSIDFILNQLERGITVEGEHTSHPKIAEEIALDHLWELPDYYNRLDKMEKEGESKDK